LKPESQQDVADANENISRLKTEIEDAQAQLGVLVKGMESYSAAALNGSKEAYETTLIEQIRAANSRLENLNAQVKAIKLEYRFDGESAKRAIFEATKKTFSLNPTELGTKDGALQDALFCVEPAELSLKEKFIEALEQRPKGRDLTKAQTALIELFQTDKNFELLKLIVKKALSDSYSFKVINVYYDGKLLPESSFGQRCTAALVLLLLLGNNPIIIDEPEGHLDSLLIANYLVELIKKAKEHRQIIFATHNANLVVNGDADLIYHLEISDQKKTKVTGVVLEDNDERHRIISLEGGPEAFRKREHKYRKRAT
jgi:DNA repair exonuclease SbcCD ATPase subunit